MLNTAVDWCNGLSVKNSRLRVFENGVLRVIVGLETGENCIMRSFIICTAHQTLFI
jgi:hypothetical protein